MGDELNRRFLIVAGKGGVGRTTLSAMIGLAAAKQGKRVLIAMCHVKEQLSRMLEAAPIGPDIVSVLPGIDAVNMFPEAALKEYGKLKLKVPLVYRAVFENPSVMAFLRATPGIDAWSMLGKVCYHVQEKSRDRRDRYDMVILDAPATGHCLDMLRVPRVIMDLAPKGLLRRDAEKASLLLQDATQTAAIVVSWPEEMPIVEAIELTRGLEMELGVSVASVVVNGVMPELFSPDERAAMLQNPPADTDGSETCLRQVAYRRSLREREQVRLMGMLKHAIDKPHILIPLQPRAQLGRADLERLSARLLPT
ncbi:MAG: ArsA family ATPase [Myxococcales bacterium]|nr:ArsA family ATPase [Myxococcales bacterium]MCB9707581.1 ArsA family ATPase [Myxococcales bacterium]